MVAAGVECVLSALAARVGGGGADTSRGSECRGGNTSKAPAFIRFFQPSIQSYPQLVISPFKYNWSRMQKEILC
jgi:hypothetical protein